MPISASDMYGVILAAGEGARLRPLSFTLPKPLLPVMNKPIIQHQIESMQDIGIRKFVIVVGHLGRHIMDQFGNGSDRGVQIRYVIQEKPLGIAHAVYQLEDEVNKPFLLFLGDIFYVPRQLKEMVTIFNDREAAGVLAVKPEPKPEYVRRNFAVTVSGNGRVTRVVEKPRYVKDNLKGCGIYLFDLPIFDAIRRTPRTAMRDEYEITTAIQILIDDDLPVYPAAVVEEDMNVTVPCDLLECNLKGLANSRLENLVHSSVQAPDGTKIINSVVGEGVKFKHPITIRDSLVIANTTVNARQDLDSVVLAPDNLIQCFQ